MLAPTRSRSIQYSRTHSSTLLEREADVGSSPTSTTGHAEDRRVSEETQSKAAFNRSGRQLNWSTIASLQPSSIQLSQAAPKGDHTDVLLNRLLEACTGGRSKGGQVYHQQRGCCERSRFAFDSRKPCICAGDRQGVHPFEGGTAPRSAGTAAIAPDRHSHHLFGKPGGSFR